MKILQVVEALNKASGVTTFVENIVTHMRDLGGTVDICTMGREDLLKNLCKSTPQYDVVHIHGLWARILHRASVLAVRNRCPVVWSTHGMTAPWSLTHKWWKKCVPWYLYQKKDLARARLIHNTVELEARWNSALGFDNGITIPLGTVIPPVVVPLETHRTSRTLLFVGRIYPVKALDRLIEAFKLAASTEWKLRIVGPDQAGHMSELKSIVDGLDLNACVDFAGPKFGNDLMAEYAACDCLALVSHTENFGATVVDAMAYGKPVITGSKTPWKVVADRQCGWWVENEPSVLARALREMMNLSDRQRREMGARGRRLVEEKYSWKVVAAELLQAYSSVVQM